jgi:glycosyltransferase involved in cell wall biosynthesis
MNTMKKVLIISHEAERNGAPILILSLALLLKEKNWKIDFLIKHDGILSKEFFTYGNSTVLYRRTNKNISAKITKKLRAFWIKKKLISMINSYDVVLSNTITNGDLHFILKKHKCVYTYVHELATTMNEYTTKEEINKVLKHTKIFLYPSEAVKHVLQRRYDIADQVCEHLPYYIPDHFFKKEDARNEIREKLGLSNSDIVIGGMGNLSHRKGYDLFLLTAKKVLQINASAKFIWCGGEKQDTEWLKFKSDIQDAELDSSIYILENQPKSWKVMAAFDIFYLPSREDAYPLVALEAAMMEIAVVYFNGSGGIQEFIGNDAGLAANYLDSNDAAEKIVNLCQDIELNSKLSKQARQKYLEKHSYDAVFNLIDKTFVPVS